MLQPQGRRCSADTAWSNQRDRLRESPRRERFRYGHVRRCRVPLALISNRQLGSLMCPVYSTDTQLPDAFNQLFIQYTRSDIAGNTTNRISEMSRALAGIEPGTSGLTAHHVTDWAISPLKKTYIWFVHNNDLKFTFQNTLLKINTTYTFPWTSSPCF